MPKTILKRIQWSGFLYYCSGTLEGSSIWVQNPRQAEHIQIRTCHRSPEAQTSWTHPNMDLPQESSHYAYSHIHFHWCITDKNKSCRKKRLFKIIDIHFISSEGDQNNLCSQVKLCIIKGRLSHNFFNLYMVPNTVK